METLNILVQSILNVGAVAILPLMLLFLGLIFRLNFIKALKAGLMVGIGFQGLQLVVGFLVATLTPIIKHYASTGTGFSIVDVGWETLSAAAWATQFTAIIVPLGLIVNFLLIRFKVIKTLNVDIWNYWHILRSAAILSLILMLMGISGMTNYSISIIFGVFLSIFICYVGDKVAPYWQDYFGLEGTTCTTILQILTTLPIAIAVNYIIDKIPVVNKINISFETIGDKFGRLADPTIIGAILGAFLGIITEQPLALIIKISVGLAAAITLTPRMVKLFMEGMSPISKAARDFMIKRLGQDADINIGVDIALGVGNQTAITVAAFMIPICICLAFILPWNKFFPAAFFGSSLTYAMATVVMVSRGNMFRSVIIGCFYMTFTLFAFNFTAPLCTQFVTNSGVISLPAGVQVAAGGMNNFIDLILAAISKML